MQGLDPHLGVSGGESPEPVIRGHPNAEANDDKAIGFVVTKVASKRPKPPESVLGELSPAPPGGMPGRLPCGLDGCHG